jgi:hypothetical protein
LSRQIGIAFLWRLAALVAFLLAATTAALMLRAALEMQAVSAPLLLATLAFQAPHAAYLGAGLAAYWTIDGLAQSDQLALLACSGISTARAKLAVIWPALSLCVVMAAFNLTLFRQAADDLGRLRSFTELDTIASEVARRGVFRLGDFQLLAREVRPGEPTTLLDPLLSVGGLVLHPKEAHVGEAGLSLTRPEVVLLEPGFVGQARSGAVALPPATSASPREQLARHPAFALRGLAFALNIVTLAATAILCAERGARSRRRAWFALWLFGCVVPLLAAESFVGTLLRDSALSRCWPIVALPVAMLAVALGLSAAASQRRRARSSL